MKRDDIIKLAREAGISQSHAEGMTDFLERFAALVAAAEREKVAAWMIQRGYATGHGDTTEDLLNELNWQIAERIAAEREACAKLCERMARRTDDIRRAALEVAAENIKARGNT